MNIFVKRFIYFIFLFAGIYTVVILMDKNNSYFGVLFLFIFVFIYKPICDLIFLHIVYKYRFKDLIKKYPFWKSDIRRKLYFEKI